MINVSISKLKENPSRAVLHSMDYPVAIQSRNKTKAYLVGKDIYEKLVSFIENYIDNQAVEDDALTKEYDFEKVAEELNL